MHKSAMEEFSQGNAQAAEKKLHKVLKSARELKISCFEAKILNSLGLVNEGLNSPTQAASHYSHALELIKGRLGSDNVVYDTIAKNLARVSIN
jgi:tetratricopeptide (TPR) repeat protein